MTGTTQNPHPIYAEFLNLGIHHEEICAKLSKHIIKTWETSGCSIMETDGGGSSVLCFVSALSSRGFRCQPKCVCVYLFGGQEGLTGTMCLGEPQGCGPGLSIFPITSCPFALMHSCVAVCNWNVRVKSVWLCVCVSSGKASPVNKQIFFLQ